ncbi:MAG TPA: universal stress protein, partial [Gemmatimonadaceae bacterium]|nr:universal stress protein [Gemmatimonadaceae bacterium]
VPLARLEVAFGPPAMGLAAVADGYSADLVVLGAHRSRAGLRTWLGGTAEQLLGIARAPVLVVAQVADGLPRRVLAAATDPLLAARVRDWADGLAQRFSASEMVMTMSHAPARPTVADAADLATDDTGTELHILTEAERCRNGIIVLGCRGAGRGDGAPLDGATTAVLRRATCPVIALAEPPLA